MQPCPITNSKTIAALVAIFVIAFVLLVSYGAYHAGMKNARRCPSTPAFWSDAQLTEPFVRVDFLPDTVYAKCMYSIGTGVYELPTEFVYHPQYDMYYSTRYAPDGRQGAYQSIKQIPQDGYMSCPCVQQYLNH